jgi:hypothetical protein
MTERTVWFLVSELTKPAAEPFAVLRADTRERDDLGAIVAVVDSLHWSKEVADAVAEQRNREVEGSAIS